MPPPTCACSSLYNCYYHSSLFDTRRQTITSVSITTMIIKVIRRYVKEFYAINFLPIYSAQLLCMRYSEIFASYYIFHLFGDHLRQLYIDIRNNYCVLTFTTNVYKLLVFDGFFCIHYITTMYMCFCF